MAKKDTKSNKKEVKKENKNKKSFFKGLKAELKKVVWPTPKQLFNNTVAVVTIVLVTAAIVFVLDLTFESLNKHGVEKIKSAITTMQEEQTKNENNNEENTSNENSNEANENEQGQASEAENTNKENAE